MTHTEIAESRFSQERLSRLAQLERSHFWFVGRRALVEQLLKRYGEKVSGLTLDLGCGTGWMLEILSRQGFQVMGLDLRPEGLSATRRALPRSWLLQARAPELPLQDNLCGTVLLLDVLEHVDDQALLAEVRRILRPGGLAVITVPALPRLWSYRDEDAGHLRRYTRQQLRRVLEGADFRVQEMRYYQCLLFPLLALTRWLGRRGPRLRNCEEYCLPVVNTLLAWVNRLEVKLGDTIPWPWGSSLAVVCRKMPA